MSQYAHLSEPDVEVAAAIAKLGSNQSFSNFHEARELEGPMVALIENYREPYLPPGESYRLQDHTVPVDGGEITIRSYIPTPSDVVPGHTFPLLVWFHGGGWAVGSLKLDDYYLREICVDLQISVLNVEYRLAPEHPFPIGLNDCYSALKWAVENHSLFKASLHKGFIIGGSSAGANLSAVLAHRARDDSYFQGRPVTGQLLQIPLIIHPDEYPDEYKPKLLSMEQNKDAPILNKENILRAYDSLKAPPSDPEISVLLDPNHKGLSPAYIQVAGLDPLRDEGFLYEDVLKEAGVRTRLDSYRIPHGFHNFFPNLGICQKLDRDSREGLRWLLDRDAVTAA